MTDPSPSSPDAAPEVKAPDPGAAREDAASPGPSPHGLAVILVQPRIPQNVGAIGRLCAATRTDLRIIRPIPFELSDKSLRRAGMDYLELLSWRDHHRWEDFAREHPPGRCWFFSSAGTVDLFDVPFRPGDALVFGNESAGLPQLIPEVLLPDRTVRIPMLEPRARCLNLATAVTAALYEAIRQTTPAGFRRPHFSP